MIHELKCDSRYFEDIRLGTKKFEVRRNDRDFCAGDLLVLRELGGGGYTGRTLVASVNSCWLNLPGVEAGYIIMDIKLLSNCFQV